MTCTAIVASRAENMAPFLILLSRTVSESVKETVDCGDVFDNPTLLHATHKLVQVQVQSRQLKLLDVVVRLRRRLLALHRHLSVGQEEQNHGIWKNLFLKGESFFFFSTK